MEQMAMLEGEVTTHCDEDSSCHLFFKSSAAFDCPHLLMLTCLAGTNAWFQPLFVYWVCFVVCGHKACRTLMIGPVIFSHWLISEYLLSTVHTLCGFSLEDSQYSSYSNNAQDFFFFFFSIYIIFDCSSLRSAFSCVIVFFLFLWFSLVGGFIFSTT